MSDKSSVAKQKPVKNRPISEHEQLFHNIFAKEIKIIALNYINQQTNLLSLSNNIPHEIKHLIYLFSLTAESIDDLTVKGFILDENILYQK